MLPNSPEFIFCWFATIRLNITLIPVNTQLKGEALSYIISHAAPHLVITNTNLLAEVGAVAEVLPATCRLLVLNNAATLPFVTGYEVFDFRLLFEQAPVERPNEIATSENDTALIIYTFGTTGHPKGVMLNRRAQTNHPLYYHQELILTTPEQVAYTYLPLFHVTSMGVTMGSFVNGARLALDTEFNVLGFWERIRRHQAVVFPYLGAALSMLYARPPREDDTNHPARWALGGAPGGAGAASAIKRALNSTKIEPEAIDYIVAHGTGTPLNDAAETQAIKTAFGEKAYHLAISSPKSMVGHLLGGAGAISGLAAVLALRDDIVPPTINLNNPAPDCDLDYVPNVARYQPLKVAMINGFGFGGQNAVAIFRKVENT